MTTAMEAFISVHEAKDVDVTGRWYIGVNGDMYVEYTYYILRFWFHKRQFKIFLHESNIDFATIITTTKEINNGYNFKT